jgi:hypothetical protein
MIDNFFANRRDLLIARSPGRNRSRCQAVPDRRYYRNSGLRPRRQIRLGALSLMNANARTPRSCPVPPSYIAREIQTARRRPRCSQDYEVDTVFDLDQGAKR